MTVRGHRHGSMFRAAGIILKRDNYRCVSCGASPSNDQQAELEVDHVYPVASGGSNGLENLQTLCRTCNEGKKDR